MNQMKKASSDLTREFKKETSGLQNEINAVQSKVKDQVESVNREFNRTKAQVNTEMKVETQPTTSADPVSPAVDPPSEKQPGPAPPQPEISTSKTE